MNAIPRKLVVDEEGKPQEVIISWRDFQEIEQVLGLDLSPDAVAGLRQAQLDRANDAKDAWIDLDAV